MTLVHRILKGLRALFRRKGVERDLDAELRAFFETAVEHKIRSGLGRDEALRAARLELGSEASVKDAVRDAGWESLVESFWRDVGYACRSFARTPGFTVIAVLTLGLGIGANTAIFSVVNAVLLKPLPYQDSNRIVRLMMNAPPSESPTKKPLRASLGLTAAEIGEVKARLRTLSHVGSAGPILRGLSGKEEAARLQGSRVSTTVFDMLEARPMLGRVFAPDDELPRAEPVIVLSYGAWRRFFQGTPDILGSSLTMDSVLGPRTQYRYTVVGVMPQGFEYPDRQTQFWLPFQGTAQAGSAPLRGPLVARLGNGVSIQVATAEIESVLRGIRPQAPATRYELVREQSELVKPVKPALLVLTAAVGFVLLIACVNVANLLLARTAARQREIAIRVAIGAGRGRLIRQMLTESALLALLGGLAGTVFAFGGIRLFQQLATTVSRVDLSPGLAFPRLEEVGVDTYVLAFTVATCLVTGLLFGLAPALVHSQSDPVRGLRGDSSSALRTNLMRWPGMRNLLVVAEVGLAMVLLIGGGLLIHSLMKLSTVNPGYNPENVLTFQVSLPVARYRDARLRAFAEDLVAHLRSVPGVQGAAYANQLPMVNLSDTAGGLWTTPDPTRGPSPGGPDARFVSRDYLRVFGIRVLAGRGFTENDKEGHPRVLLVNQALVNREFAGENPIGRTVFVGRDIAPWEVVGVVEDVRQFGLDRDPEPQFFAELRQWSGTGPLFPVGAYYAVRTTAEPEAFIANVRGIIRGLDDEAALFNIAPMNELVASTISRPRTFAVLLGIFAVVGVALAIIGIYGVMAYSVTQRTREIGIRMALGARRNDVLSLVLRKGLALTAIGIGLGLAGAAAVSRYLEGMLFGLTPFDGSTFLAVSVMFVSVAALASYVPARRAANVDPLIALRCE
jgi:putative ABC transport system permease protein